MGKVANKKYKTILDLLKRAIQCFFEKIRNQDVLNCFVLLEECQESAIALGSHIEKTYGKETKTVKLLEEYCEYLYETGVLLESNQNWDELVVQKIVSSMQRKTEELENVFKEELDGRLEVVFMPYKAAMWDSLESVWMAAEGDPNCDAYVIPIPYYDRNPDHSFGTFHYEGDQFPTEVPITHYDDYNLEERQPDVIYIHNPYDWANNATSVDPRFYSDKLKENTNCLVYIPYYTTSGGMAEAQEKCLAYYNADYIVIQSEKYRKFFDPDLPDEKFLPYGSPKFDRVIRICNNPPEPPVDWVEKMQGKKVYFYNTSLNGMLQDTDSFFKKMQYVFDCFKGREDACLLWRPHPLFETTIDSMRPAYKTTYEKLKKYFKDNQLGIYDTTPDITNTIAHCDAYVGDAGSSVVSLFGVAGKPIFILNNRIHSLPEEDDWRGEIIRYFSEFEDEDWKVIQGNKLYHAPNSDHKYHYVCDLCDYAGGRYFSGVITINEKSYVCPLNAQEIVVIEDEKIIERIQLIKELEQPRAFCGAIAIGEYLYLIPYRYPAIVRYHVKRKTVDYIKGYNDVFVKQIDGEWRMGGYCVWNNNLFVASPLGDKVLAIDNLTRSVKLLSTGATHTCGCVGIISRGEEVWMLPFTGKIITRWNPKTGERREYSNLPKGFVCKNRPFGYLCEDRPFGWLVSYRNYIYLSPTWGNMFVCLDEESGKMEEWNLPVPDQEERKSDYYCFVDKCGCLAHITDDSDEVMCQYFSYYNAKLYNINLKTNIYEEILIEYDETELRRHVSGFCEDSEWLKYCCMEDSFNTLVNFLDDSIIGKEFNKMEQIRSYEEINASCDGTCGRKLHEIITFRLKNV